MNRLRLATCVVLVSLGCATTREVAEPRPPSPPNAGLAVSQVLELEHARAEAISQADAFSLESLLEDGYRGLGWDQQRRTKSQEVQKLRADGGRALLTLALVADEMEVRVYGDFAVATGRANLENPTSKLRDYREVRFTHVWLWRDARWQLVAAHEHLVAR